MSEQVSTGEANALNIDDERARGDGRRALDRGAGAPARPLSQTSGSSLALLETLFESSPVGVGYVNTDLRFLRVNDALAELHGRAAHEHVGHTPEEILPETPDVARSFRTVLDTREPLLNREINHVDASGRQQYWLASFYPVASDGALLGIGTVVTDVTDRRRAQRRDAVRHAVERVLATSDSLEAASPKLLAAVCEALGWEVGAMWGFDQHAGVLRCAAIWSQPVVASTVSPFVVATGTRTFDPGEGLPGRVWDGREPAWVSDVARDPSFKRAQAAKESGLHTALALPIGNGGEPVGVLEFYTRAMHPKDDDLLATLRSTGAVVGQFVKRKWAEAELVFQRALLHSQSEATSDGIIAVSASGHVVSFNQRVLDMWGIDQSSLESSMSNAVSAMRVRLHPESNPIDGMASDAEGGEVVLQDGRIIEWRGAPLLPGNDLGRALYFRDVTEQRTSEHELIEGRRRFAFLAQAGTLLASSLHSSAILERLARLSVPALGDWCAIDELRDDGSIKRLVVTCADPNDKPLARKLKRYAPAPDDPLFEAIRTLSPVLMARITDPELISIARNPSHLQLLRKLGCRSMMIVPLLARGRLFGTITLARGYPSRPYEQDDVDLADELARRAALAIENAALYRERGHIARALQQSLLPPALPDIPRIDLADRYLAAGELNEVGGDFYDAFETGRNDWAIVIGDVCGKGPDAAAVTALARYTIRAAAMNARKPSRVLGVLNGALLQHSTVGDFCRFCTVAYARLRTTREGQLRMTLASGGHPSPLLLRPDGQVITLSRTGVALGVIDEPHVVDRSTTLETGDAVIFFTDGVIEARGAAGHIFGNERLESTLQACAGLPATEIADRVHQAVVGFQRGEPRDDIALIVLRVTS